MASTDLDDARPTSGDRAGPVTFVRVGGAVGSNMSNAEEVRRATFSNREYERRQLSLAKEEEAGEEVGGST